MPKQLEIRFDIPRDATPEEQRDWIENKLTPQANASMKYVVYASLIQLGCLGFMLGTMYIIDKFV